MGRTVSSDVIFKSLSPESKKRVKAKIKKEIEEIKSLQEIRKQIGVTQNDMAKSLKIKQKNVSSLESRSDMLVSTLKGYVEAMGCELEIFVKKPDQTRLKFGTWPNEEKHI